MQLFTGKDNLGNPKVRTQIDDYITSFKNVTFTNCWFPKAGQNTFLSGF